MWVVINVTYKGIHSVFVLSSWMWPLFNQETCLQRCRGAVFWQESCPFSFMTRILKRRRQQREPLKAIRIITNFVVSIALRILEFSVPPIIQSSRWGRDYANNIATCSSSFARSWYPLNGVNRTVNFSRTTKKVAVESVFFFAEGRTEGRNCLLWGRSFGRSRL